MNAPALALAGTMTSPKARAYRLMCRAINHHRKIYVRADRPVPAERLGRIVMRCADLCRLTYRLATMAGERV